MRNTFKKIIYLIILSLFAVSGKSQVYSANTVGYCNIAVSAGISCFANPLDADGTGTNNTIQGIFGTNVLSGTVFYKFINGNYVSYSFAHGGWSGNASLNPGEAVMLLSPSATNITVLGNVLQGSLTNSINAGLTLVSSKIPVNNLFTNIGLNPPNSTIFYFWANNEWLPCSHGRGGWQYVPTNVIGQGFFIEPGVAFTWTQKIS